MDYEVSQMDADDRRRWPRGGRDDTLIVKVVTSSDTYVPPGRTFICRSSDISLRGVRLRINREIRSGTGLELWVISPRHQRTLVLDGVVRWCKPKREDQFTHQLGVEIEQTAGTDFAEWSDFIKDLLPTAG